MLFKKGKSPGLFMSQVFFWPDKYFRVIACFQQRQFRLANHLKRKAVFVSALPRAVALRPCEAGPILTGTVHSLGLLFTKALNESCADEYSSAHPLFTFNLAKKMLR